MESHERPEPITYPIIKALSDYKMSIIHKNTLLTQAPDELQDLRTILRSKAKTIKNYITRRAMPDMLDLDDPDLYNFIQILNPMLNPWDADISVLAKYYCEKLFETDNFSNAEHVERILSNSKEHSIMPASASASASPAPEK